MKKKEVKDISASVRSRLLNLARSTGRNFQELTIRYTVERFLTRLVMSEYRNRFILKGAMLYIPWELDNKRTTMDLDLLGFGDPDMENLKYVFKQICKTEIENDGLVFDIENIIATPIREESVYDGVRVIIQVFLGKMSIRLQVDVGFGDHVVPEPRSTEFPALLTDHGPVIRSYSPETVIAEKFNAMIILGMANSRMKDYYDIWMLSQNFIIDAEVLMEALEQTFNKRRTKFPDNIPIALSNDFFTNESKKNQWNGFIRKQRKTESIPGLSETVKTIHAFLMPIVSGINTGTLTVKKWQPEKGWV